MRAGRPVRHPLPLRFALGLALLASITAGPTSAGSPALDQAAGSLARQLLARVARSHARVIEFEPSTGTGRLDLGSSAGLERWTPLILTAAAGDSSTVTAGQCLGELEIVRLSDRELEFRPQPGTAPARVATGQSVRVYLERHAVALAAPSGGPFTAGAAQRLMAALEARLDSPVFRLVRMPALSDTAEAQQMARAAGVDLFGWTRIERAAKDALIRLTLLRAKDGTPLPEINATLPADDGALAPAGPDEDPAASLPGCRSSWTGAPVTGVVLDIFPRRFKPGALDLYFADRIEGWKLGDGRLSRWQARPLADLWPPTVGTRWPVGSLLPVNSYYAKDRSESRVFYAFCSNQRPRYLSVSLAREDPDSLMLSVADGPQDTLNGCTGSCFAQVDRVERIARFPAPRGLPKTAGTRLALGRVDLGPSGLPAYDEKGYVKTRKSALLFYDLPSATLWLASADTAFRVPGHFGDRVDGFRVGKAGPAGFLATAAGPVGRPDRLQYWIWDAGRLTLRWQSDPFEGSITALQVADLDGDARDDVIVGETLGADARARTRLRLYLAALEPTGASR